MITYVSKQDTNILWFLKEKKFEKPVIIGTYIYVSEKLE